MIYTSRHHGLLLPVVRLRVLKLDRDVCCLCNVVCIHGRSLALRGPPLPSCSVIMFIIWYLMWMLGFCNENCVFPLVHLGSESVLGIIRLPPQLQYYSGSWGLQNFFLIFSHLPHNHDIRSSVHFHCSDIWSKDFGQRFVRFLEFFPSLLRKFFR